MTRFLPAISPLVIVLLLAACSSVLIIPSTVVEPLDQFPVGTVIIETRGRKYPFQVWVADTPPRRSQGLMHVRGLDADRGMLFLFDKPTHVVMWMKNMAMPIDMLFISPDGRVLCVVRNALPDSRDSIRPDEAVTGVIELPGGTVSRLRLAAGDRVRHTHFSGWPGQQVASRTDRGSDGLPGKRALKVNP